MRRSSSTETYGATGTVSRKKKHHHQPCQSLTSGGCRTRHHPSAFGNPLEFTVGTASHPSCHLLLTRRRRSWTRRRLAFIAVLLACRCVTLAPSSTLDSEVAVQILDKGTMMKLSGSYPCSHAHLHICTNTCSVCCKVLLRPMPGRLHVFEDALSPYFAHFSIIGNAPALHMPMIVLPRSFAARRVGGYSDGRGLLLSYPRPRRQVVPLDFLTPVMSSIGSFQSCPSRISEFAGYDT
jgi:hypothetical protein